MDESEKNLAVLIARGDTDLLAIASFCLGRPAGSRVFLASSGDEACAMAQNEPPDALLLDLRMPGAGGAQTLERLRQREDTRHIPAVVMTARGEREGGRSAGDRGRVLEGATG